MHRLIMSDDIHTCCSNGLLGRVKEYINKGGEPTCKDSKGNTLLHSACRSRNCELVRYLCEVANTSTSSKNKEGDTPLHLACHAGCYQIVAYLIDDRKCEINTKNNIGNVPLKLACNQGHLDVVKYMINTTHCNTTIRGFCGENLLHAACRSSNLELVKYLVEQKGFDIHQRKENKRRRTALHVASQFSSVAVVQWLVEQGLNPEERDEIGVTPIHVVSDIKVLKYFLEPEPPALNCKPSICGNIGQTPLHCSVFRNNIELVKYFVSERKCDPMQSDNNGNTCIHLAAKNGALIVLKFLEKSGFEMNSKNKDGDTALCLACKNGHLDVVKYLISSGRCDTTVRGFHGENLLHAACRSCNLELVQYLVKQKSFDIHQRRENKWRRTALHIASQFSNTAVVQWLVQQGSNPEERDKIGVTPLHLVSDINVLKYLLEPEPLGLNCNPSICNDNGQTPLHFAAAFNKIELVKYLINERKRDPMHSDNNGNTCVHLAASSGALVVLKFIVKSGCKINAKNKDAESALCLASRNGHLDVVKYLINTGHCNTTVKGVEGESLLHVACRSDNLELVQYLVKEKRFDIHQRSDDKQRRTALHVASQFSGIAVVQWLVEQGLNPEERDKSGVTPLHVVSDINVLKYFLEPVPSGLNCNPNICSNGGQTPLHFAVCQNRLEVVNYLISDRKCDPMHRDNNGNTCPHLAAKNGALMVLKVLDKSGCKMNSKNKEGDTALCIACKNGHLDIVKYIMNTRHCNTTVTEFNGEGLLHVACRSSNLELVQYLVKEKGFNIHLKTYSRRTALHVASQFSNIALVQWLVQQGLNPAEKDNSGVTPLHVVSDINVLRFFLEPTPSGLNCNPMDIDNHWNTCLHLAAGKGNLAVIKFLDKSGIEMNKKNKDGDTALCLACRNGHLDVVKYMISTDRCNTTVRGFQGESLLHAACRSTNLELIQYLVEQKRFSIDQRKSNWNRKTALHVASKHSSIPVVQWLVEQGLNPEETDENGVTPLHVVSDINVLKYFLEPKPSGLNCNPRICSYYAGRTPLHFAVRQNKIEFVKYLINEMKCDPMYGDKNGDTCPHLAATFGAVEILIFLLKLGCDLDSKNDKGWSPLHCALKANSSSCVKFLLDIAKCKLEFPKKSVSSLQGLNIYCINCILHSEIVKNHTKRNFMELYVTLPSYFSQKADETVKLAVLGDSRAGKSTLVKALTEEVKSSFRDVFLSETNKTVKGVEEYTAGIVTHEFESKHFGHTLIFDFAGHEEYHASHSEVMARFLIQDTIVLLVVDISQSNDVVYLTLKRWLNFVNILCSRASTCCHMLVIASHCDHLKNKSLRIEKMEYVHAMLDDISSQNEYVNISNMFELDCRKLVSSGLGMVRKELHQLSSKLRSQFSIDMRCLEIMEHINNEYSNCPCCTVGDFFKSLQWYDLKCKDIVPLLQCLHRRGCLILSGSKSGRVEENLLIFNYADLLKTVNGSIFAPDSFRSIFKGLSTNTGIITFHKLKKCFPKIPDVNVIIVYLEHFQFCKELTLPLLSKFTMVPGIYSAEERFFFFPSLVVQARDEIVSVGIAEEQINEKREVSFWLLKALNDGEFPANFLHHIILHLVVNYLKNPKESDLVDEVPVIQKICKLWNTGICWSGSDGSVLVEILEKKALVVLVSCVEGRKLEMMELRSRLVQDILMIKHETCGNMPVSESLVPKQLIPSYQPKFSLIQSLECYSMEEIRDCVKEFGSQVVNSQVQRRAVADVVIADPFCMLSSQQVMPNVLSTMLDNLDKQIHSRHIIELANSFSELIDLTLLRKILRVNISSTQTSMPPENQFQQIFSTWIQQREGRATYRILFKELSRYSIFCGRNPMTLEWVCHPLMSRLDSNHGTSYTPSQPSQFQPCNDLDSSHVADVMNWLINVTEYMRLGLELGLSYALLKKIRSEEHEKVDNCKMSLLKSWLTRADRVDQMGGANKQALVAALRRMGEHRLANEILPGYDPLQVVVVDALPDGDLDPSDHLVIVLRELDVLTDWRSLGLQLGLHNSTLTKIDQDEQNTDHRKMAMLHSWLSIRDCVKDKGGATKNALVRALSKIGEKALAHRIQTKRSNSSHFPTLSSHTTESQQKLS